jgi:hypothetical protein
MGYQTDFVGDLMGCSEDFMRIEWGLDLVGYLMAFYWDFMKYSSNSRV